MSIKPNFKITLISGLSLASMDAPQLIGLATAVLHLVGATSTSVIGSRSNRYQKLYQCRAALSGAHLDYRERSSSNEHTRRSALDAAMKSTIAAVRAALEDVTDADLDMTLTKFLQRAPTRGKHQFRRWSQLHTATTRFETALDERKAELLPEMRRKAILSLGEMCEHFQPQPQPEYRPRPF